MSLLTPLQTHIDFPDVLSEKEQTYVADFSGMEDNLVCTRQRSLFRLPDFDICVVRLYHK